MHEHPSPGHAGTFQVVSIADAARILKLSESTVRRLVKAGRLEAERVERPQGHVWAIRIPAAATERPAPTRHVADAAASHPPPQPPALAAWMSSVLEPLMAELSVTRHQLVSQAEQIGALRAERDAARAELAAAHAPQSPPDASGSTQVPGGTTDTPAPWRRPRWLPALLAALAVAVLLLLLSVPR